MEISATKVNDGAETGKVQDIHQFFVSLVEFGFIDMSVSAISDSYITINSMRKYIVGMKAKEKNYQFNINLVRRTEQVPKIINYKTYENAQNKSLNVLKRPSTIL
ncbi:Hypothetical protein CINCED_3A022075 [Cinara cedri]|uniref:Uncharacterized protein n=1 Tax=Cinara cedri TaxID=506608 RepID=A0A5E4MN33_9HEMI|nr:Hypothetical protein CINCED_3A022075 [Cinara cedri]